MEKRQAYLSVCSMYKDHAEYLREWIEFHRLVGVERFFLYDNESSDDHRDVLAPYIERGIVVVHDWPTPPSVERGVPWGIIPAFEACLATHRDDSRWIAFLDVDEFLFSPTGRPLPEVLRGFEQWSGVEVSRLDFGSSGHDRKPPGLVIENFVHRRRYAAGELEYVKSIVQPARTSRPFNAHGFYYEEGFAVREDGERAEEYPVPGKMAEPIAELLRINHYITKSQEDYEQKSAQWAAAGRPWRNPDEGWLESLNTERDEAITRYVPSLREALDEPVT